ncbi:hypothetical protein VB711_00810 [Cronbergia sp. UHCC 0137]|uniref:hypothetical protein n=1 Tax=Cronbergia sp. UHCC 0137 TaxID=3110239 RepID=UPI002B1F642A|nr:hypothetical protein [Cronbergia sp. UHCC 0137]MEA5616384.1 hypothetical protein [Cronbergia sp. UHCC 0137]
MKALRLFTIVSPALAMSLVFSQVNLAQTPKIEISRNLANDPIIINGESLQTVPSNCGNITPIPNQVIKVTESLPYLRLTVESKGNPTLLVDGPGGRFCLLPDDYSGQKPELSGYWQAGEYSLYVGDLSEKKYSYTLSISQQHHPK